MDGGENVLIFPEGTRSSDAILHDFKSGGFHLAIESGVPIVPVTVSGSQWVTPKGSLRIESGRVLIRYGKPIATEPLTVDDRNDLKKRVREAILAGCDPPAPRRSSRDRWPRLAPACTLAASARPGG